MKNSSFLIVEKEELLSEFRSCLEQVVRNELRSDQLSQKILTSKEVAKLFKVSLLTIRNWTEKGLLTKYSIGGQVRYKYVEVINALKAMEAKKSAS